MSARRVMGIGVGVLALLSTAELEGVLAHEFGHYLGGETRLGGFLYRTRASIGRVLEHLGGSVLAKPFAWYGNLFLRLTHGLSRRQELAADAHAVAIAGTLAATTLSCSTPN
jgi:Zn-dependent protease with chaperone function